MKKIFDRIWGKYLKLSVKNIFCRSAVVPGTPAGGEDDDDDEEHLDDLPPALIDLDGVLLLAGGAVQAAPLLALLRWAEREGG